MWELIGRNDPTICGLCASLPHLSVGVSSVSRTSKLWDGPEAFTDKPYDQESWAVNEERPPPPPTLITPLPQILHIGETGCLVSFAQIVLSDRNQTIHNGSPTVGLPPVPEGVASCHDGTAYLETRAVHSNTEDLTITIKAISNHGASSRHPEFGWLQRPHGHGLP